MASVYMDKRRGTWWIKWRATDGFRREKLGKHPTPFPPNKPPKRPPDFISQRAAPYFDRERDAKTNREGSPTTGIDGYLGEFLDAFKTTHGAGSSKLMARTIENFLAFCKARKVGTVQEVTRAICRDYLESLLGKLSPNTIKTERSYIASPFTRAADDGLIPSNPWRGVKSPGKPDPGDPVFWSGPDVLKIADAMTTGWHRDFVLFLANTGMRVSAGLASEFGWADVERRVIRVPLQHSKGGKPYEVPMTVVAQEVIERRRPDAAGPFIFGRPDGKRYQYSGFLSAFAAAVKKARVKPGTPHDLRHTFARALCMAGVPINVVQRALGHASLAMTQRYTDVTAEAASEHIRDFRVG